MTKLGLEIKERRGQRETKRNGEGERDKKEGRKRWRGNRKEEKFLMPKMLFKMIINHQNLK